MTDTAIFFWIAFILAIFIGLYLVHPLLGFIVLAIFTICTAR
jgi:hypothetical protein